MKKTMSARLNKLEYDLVHCLRKYEVNPLLLFYFLHKNSKDEGFKHEIKGIIDKYEKIEIF